MSSHRKHPKAKQQGKAANKDNHNAVEYSPKEKAVEPDLPPSQDNKTYTTNQLRDGWDYASFWVGVVTLIVLGIYTVINYGLYRETVDTNQATQRAAIFETRVEMIKSNAELLKQFPKNVTASIETHFRNFGPTAGTKVRAVTSACLRSSDPSDDFSYRDLEQIPHVEKLVAPQENFAEGIPSRAEDVDAVLAYKTSLYVWGTVSYLDVFSKPHFTAFCVKYEGTGADAGSSGLVQLYEQCPAHNCVDDNCPKNHFWGYNDTIECQNTGPSASTRVPAPAPK